jgi:hypothetical protein
LIATLDAHGVPFAVIAAASPWGDYNDCILAALRAHPRRLRGTAILPPTAGRYELEGMTRDGFLGVRLPFMGLAELPDIATFDYRRFLRRLADLDWHVHLHVESERMPALLPAIEDSVVKLVIDHMGRPDPKTGIAGAGFKAMLGAVERGRTWVARHAGTEEATRISKLFLYQWHRDRPAPLRVDDCQRGPRRQGHPALPDLGWRRTERADIVAEVVRYARLPKRTFDRRFRRPRATRRSPTSKLCASRRPSRPSTPSRARSDTRTRRRSGACSGASPEWRLRLPAQIRMPTFAHRRPDVGVALRARISSPRCRRQARPPAGWCGRSRAGGPCAHRSRARPLEGTG